MMTRSRSNWPPLVVMSLGVKYTSLIDRRSHSMNWNGARRRSGWLIKCTGLQALRAAISSNCSSKNNDQYTKLLRTIFKTLPINVSSNSEIVGFVKKITVSSCFGVNEQTSVSAVLIYFFQYPWLVIFHVAVAKEYLIAFGHESDCRETLMCSSVVWSDEM